MEWRVGEYLHDNDHFSLHIHYTNPVQRNAAEENHHDPPKNPLWNFKKANWGGYGDYSEQLINELQDHDISQPSIDELLRKLTDAIEEAASRNIPLIKCHFRKKTCTMVRVGRI